jgi:hypothetical protein
MPVSAYPPQCIDICQPNDSCSKTCYEDLTRSTCGDAGMSCDGGPSCSPNYQIVNEVAVGGWAVDDPFSFTCQYYNAYQQTWHDQNQCNAEFWPDYNTCTQGPQSGATAGYGQCCSYYYCFGHSC